MKTNVLLRKLHLEGKEFATAEEIKEYCRPLKIDPRYAINYFLSRKYMTRILRGVFYVRSPEEIKLGRSKYSHLELVSRGLEARGVKNWYFALYTALKLNNMTHEHFSVDYVISDSIFRAKPIGIAGHKFRFLRLKPSLTTFGIEGEGLKRSDPEKTILDMIYVSRYNGVPEDKIAMDVSEYSKALSGKKISGYANMYPKSVRKIAERVME